jgi:hypothetical protein
MLKHCRQDDLARKDALKDQVVEKTRLFVIRNTVKDLEHIDNTKFLAALSMTTRGGG